MATPALLRRFWPYMARYKGILCFDLFCAALTSVCELVLPLIMRSITNMGVNDLSSLTVSYILRVGALIWCFGSLTAQPTTLWPTRAM